MKTWRTRCARLGLAVSLGIGLGCSQGKEDASTSGRGAVLFDFAAELPSATLRPSRRGPAGPSASQSVPVRLGEGWWETEASADGRVRWAWARARSAEIEIDLPAFGDAESLVLRLKPYRYPDAPVQHVDVQVNGSPAGTLTLREGVHDYPVPAPEDSLRPGTNTLRLEFAQTARPSDHSTSADARALAAAFYGVLIRGAGASYRGEPGASLPEPSASVEGADLLQSAGSDLSYSVPEARGAVLELGVEPADSRPEARCPLSVQIRMADPAGPPEILLAAPVSAVRGRRLSIPIPAVGASRIVFGVESRACRGAGTSLRWRAPRLVGPEDSRTIDETSNVVFIVIDTLRADRVGLGRPGSRTEHLDALAASGVAFRRAYSHVPITGPSHSSMFTGLFPAGHGVQNNTQILDEELTTLAELMRDSGRTTAAFVSLGVLKAKFGLSQGFDHYDDTLGPDWWRDSRQVNESALEWLDANGDRPFFLWAHYCDPHEPYTPAGLDYPRVTVVQDGRQLGSAPADGRTTSIAVSVPPGKTTLTLRAMGPDPGALVFRGLRVRPARIEVAPLTGWDRVTSRFAAGHYAATLPATIEVRNPAPRSLDAELRFMFYEDIGIEEIRKRYDDEVQVVDGEIGRLLDRVRKRSGGRDTLVVLVSDHGEGLGDHEHLGHISQLYDSLLRVPMIMSFPGRVPEGATVDEPVALVDLTPTVLELLGMSVPPGLAGRSLVPLMDGGPGSSRAILVETHRPEAPQNLTGLVWRGYKYISQGPGRAEELYDLGWDPEELEDRHDDEVDLLPSLRARLRRVLVESGMRASARSAELTEDERQKLRDLGYVH